jgi:hypothetical protein
VPDASPLEPVLLGACRLHSSLRTLTLLDVGKELGGLLHVVLVLRVRFGHRRKPRVVWHHLSSADASFKVALHYNATLSLLSQLLQVLVLLVLVDLLDDVAFALLKSVGLVLPGHSFLYAVARIGEGATKGRLTRQLGSGGVTLRGLAICALFFGQFPLLKVGPPVLLMPH